MSRFLKRLVGNYVEQELLMNIVVTKLTCKAPKAFTSLVLEFKRGDKVERSLPCGSVNQGEGEYEINWTFNKVSMFRKEQDTNPPKWLQKEASILVYGISDKKTLLGEVTLDVAPYCMMMKQKIQLKLEGGSLKKAKLDIVMSIISPELADQIDLDLDVLEQENDNLYSESTTHFEVDDSKETETDELARLRIEHAAQSIDLQEINNKLATQTAHVSILDATLKQVTAPEAKPVRASDLGRLRIKLEDKDSEIARLNARLLELERL